MSASDRITCYAWQVDDVLSDVDNQVNDLAALGFSDDVRERLGGYVASGLLPARITRVDRGMPIALSEQGVFRVEYSPSLRETSGSTPKGAVVGDWVGLSRPDGHQAWLIDAILPRKSAFHRKDPAEGTEQQVVIANVDVIFVMQSLSGAGINVRRLERELVMAWESGAVPVIVLSKADLVDDPDGKAAVAREIAFGVDVIIESAVTGLGVEEILMRIPAGSTAALLGSSGVGKSTLVNRLLGTESIKTAQTRSKDDKGRHTTTAREMFAIPGGGVIIDTPGMRGLSLWNSHKGMTAAFPDIVSLEEQCHFGDCAHDREPGCAVSAAVSAGELKQGRVDSWRRLQAELDELTVRQEDIARRGDGKKSKSRPVGPNHKARGRGVDQEY